ncbi:MAG: M1 family metallopeptidase [Balneolaceae bacterium]
MTLRYSATVQFLPILLFLFTPVLNLHAQNTGSFTRADSLRGSITPERAWWDVTHYDLHLSINPADSTISGVNHITYRVTGEPTRMQIDLQVPLAIDRVEQSGEEYNFERDGNIYYIDLPEELPAGSLQTISVFYSGHPRIAPNPPWDGGFIWAEDGLGNPWIATANQGLGASVWWPNKDHQTEEPDSMTVHVTVPDPLINVSNGRLTDQKSNEDGTTTWSWHVTNPINNYNIAVNTGSYAHFGETFNGEQGPLDLDYWVLEQNLEKAQEQFKQVKPMLQCFEEWFGPYPFYEDSFKIVETPHLGMEHQSAVAYGNGYVNGYRGNDLSGSGWGLKFDFILIHETGHEWFGNNITTEDLADMWIHEGFTNYSEGLYVECMFGKKAGREYIIGTRQGIQNRQPIIARYGVNDQGSGDMYPKGGNLLHMVRQIMDHDEKWRQTLRELNETYRHGIVTSAKVEAFLNGRAGYDLSPVFDQYLRHTDIPVLEYYLDDENLFVKWSTDVSGFDMPVKVTLRENSYSFIHPEDDHWKSIPHNLADPSSFDIDENFYIRHREHSVPTR